MKPLSERIKSFSADQFIDWLCLACVDVREVRTEEDAQAEINTIRSVVKERLSALEQESQKNLDGALAWQQRAEAAEAALAEEKRINSKLREDRAGLARECNAFEAKLAELERQEPVGWMTEVEVDELHRGVAEEAYIYKSADAASTIPLFTRPAPAINLAELVPSRKSAEDYVDDKFSNRDLSAIWNSCVSEMLRNIEEQSQ